MNAQTPPIVTPEPLASLPSSERVQALIDLIWEFRALESQRRHARDQHLKASAAKSSSAHYWGQVNDLAVEEEGACGAKIMAHLKVLASDGTLPRCVQLLAAGTGASS